MKIQLSDKFTYGRLLRFTLPSIIMMVFTSIYGVVDGFFVSNYVGKTPFAAVNLIMPFIMIMGAVGFMIGTGGSALVAASLGSGDTKRANRIFSLLIYLVIGLGAVFCVIGMTCVEPVARLLKATDEMLPYCVEYCRIVMCSLIAFMLQNVFQSFLVTAEKPTFGLIITIAAGGTNMALDWLFMAVFDWGVAGAAIATAISQCIGGLIPLVYFILPNNSKLRLGRLSYERGAIFKTCTNGSSEFLSNISMSVVSMIYNAQLMNIAGEDGVSAYGVIMYINFIFVAVFLGYSIGSAPIVSFHYGAGNTDEVKGLLKKSLIIVASFAVLLTAAAEIAAMPLAKIFVSYDAELLDMTVRGFRIYSLAFLFCGFTIFGSGFFTALNNGLISALISFARTLVFQIACVLILPIFFGIDGIWASVVAAELFAITLTGICLIANRKKYRYY